MNRIKEPILVIDDDQSILAVISTMLSVIGFDNIINATKTVKYLFTK